MVRIVLLVMHIINSKGKNIMNTSFPEENEKATSFISVLAEFSNEG